MAGRRVVVAGATGAAGRVVCAALTAAGASVIALGSDDSRLAALAAEVPGLTVETVDLADFAAVTSLAGRTGEVDGLIHLVGGWRGGKGLTGQSDEDWEFLSRSLITTLRNTTRAFQPALLASPNARVAILSATGVDRPTAGNANYVTAKAAAETWLAAVAQSFGTGAPDTAAAVTFVIKALVDEGMRAAAPEKRFPGYTDVQAVGSAVVGLWDGRAAELNGTRVSLVPVED
ncbi:SDR family NAD(P)-dependent oxidoreductase [Nakamurella silvestris]|nr:SDR family NAD(P)-dependent oxidoreductase [Nakamurella silvestris]